MACDYASRLALVARVFVPPLVGVATAANDGSKAVGSSPCHAHWTWVLHRSGGIAATASSVVDFCVGFAASRCYGHQGPRAVLILADNRGSSPECGGIGKKTILGIWLLSANGVVVAESGDNVSNLNGSATSSTLN
jgi:hypothetical protein